MPRVSDAFRERRRRHVLESAWRCFSREGFHATSMDQVIAATGMSSSAVYRYVHSKEDLIDAAAEEALALVGGLLDGLTAGGRVPGPAETITELVGAVVGRAVRDEYDLTRIAMQAWAEALRRPELHARTRALYTDFRVRLVPIVERWQADHLLPVNVPVDDVAATIVTIVPGLIVTHQLLGDLDAQQAVRGLAGLGAALTAADPTRSPIRSL